MRMGAIGWKPGKDIFLPVSTPWRLFVGELLVMHCRRPFWLCQRVEAEASTEPWLSTPTLDILVSMSPGNPHHAAKMPKEAARGCPGLDTHCTHWTVQLKPKLVRFQRGDNSNTTKKLN